MLRGMSNNKNSETLLVETEIGTNPLENNWHCPVKMKMHCFSSQQLL